MKRDMDLCRQILLDLEDNPEAVGWKGFTFEYEGRTYEEVSYHVMLLHEAGLIEAVSHSQGPGHINWTAKKLTWPGHEFLDASRKDSVWQKAKSTVLEKTGGLSFEVLKAVVVQLAKDAVLGGGS
jgi:hypothetical protein